jgi:hypothetical protein
MRRIVALGLMAWEIKETRLKHGEFGYWLQANAPQLCCQDAATKTPKASSSLASYMQLTKGVLESTGLTVGKYLEKVCKQNSQSLGISLTLGGLILASDAQVPEQLRKLRDKIFEVVDGKTPKQLMLEFKQVEEDGQGGLKVKRGRMKGQGGASKEQCANAKATEAIAEAAAINAKATEARNTLLDVADDKTWASLDPNVASELLDAAQSLVEFHRNRQSHIVSGRNAAAEILNPVEE